MKNFKKSIVLFAGLFLMFFSVNSVMAQVNNSTDQAEASATAVIIIPIDIEKNEDLSFGNIISSATAGTVTVDFANVRTQSGGATFPTVEGTITSAQFTVTGFTASIYSITLPSDNAIQLKGVGGGDDMHLTGFVHNANELLTAGEEVFKVGATLEVNAGQAAGTYTGAFDVIVNYN